MLLLKQLLEWLSQSRRRADVLVLGLFLLLLSSIDSWIGLTVNFLTYVSIAFALLLLQGAIYTVSGHRFKWSELIGGVVRLLVLVMMLHSILSVQ